MHNLEEEDGHPDDQFTITYHINVKGMKIFNGELYGDFDIIFQNQAYKFQKDLAMTYSQTILDFCTKYPKLKSYTLQSTNCNEHLVTKTLSLLAGFRDVILKRDELLSAFEIISELKMNEAVLGFEDRFWIDYVIGNILDADTALDVLKLFYSRDSAFQEKFEGYLNRIYEKFVTNRFHCFSDRDIYLELPFKVFFTALDWYIDALKKLNANNGHHEQDAIEDLPIYDVNEITYEYIGRHNLQNDPKSTRILIDLKNTSPKRKPRNTIPESGGLDTSRSGRNGENDDLKRQVKALRKDMVDLRNDVEMINNSLKQLTGVVRDHLKICDTPKNLEKPFIGTNYRNIQIDNQDNSDEKTEILTQRDGSKASSTQELQKKIEEVHDSICKKIDLVSYSRDHKPFGVLQEGLFTSNEEAINTMHHKLVYETKNKLALDSTIISDQQSRLWLLEQLTQDQRYLGTQLLFRASEHGFAAEDFHKYCDDQGPTLTIIKTNQGVWGGFIELSWESPKAPVRKEGDIVSWLFNLNKKKIYNPTGSDCNIYCKKTMGPTFGWGRLYGFDLAVGYQFIFKGSPREGNLREGMITNGNYIFDMCSSGWISLTISEIEVFAVSLKASD